MSDRALTEAVNHILFRYDTLQGFGVAEATAEVAKLIEAARAANAEQVAAIRAAWDASTGWHQFGEDVRAILEAAHAPEPMVSVAAVRKLIAEHRFDIEAGPALSVVALEQLLDGVVESDHG